MPSKDLSPQQRPLHLLRATNTAGLKGVKVGVTLTGRRKATCARTPYVGVSATYTEDSAHGSNARGMRHCCFHDGCQLASGTGRAAGGGCNGIRRPNITAVPFAGVTRTDKAFLRAAIYFDFNHTHQLVLRQLTSYGSPKY